MPGQVGAHTTASGTETQDVAGTHDQRPAHGGRRLAERGAEIGARQGDRGGRVETQGGPHGGALEGGDVRGVAGDQVCQLVGTQVHGTAHGNAQGLMTMTAAILKGAGQTGTNDGDAHDSDPLLNSSSLIGRNWTVSPGESSVMGLRSGSNSLTG